MRRLAYYLGIIIFLALGFAIYADSFLSGSTTSGLAGGAQPISAAVPSAGATPPLPSIKPNREIMTGSIGPITRPQIEKVPGVHFAAIEADEIPRPDPERWAPAVGYGPVVAAPRPIAVPRPIARPRPSAMRMPPRVRPVRVYRPPSFGFVIGIRPGW